ncbi:MAG: ABC transporter ATP-binding protein [Planctomycetota bacterium]
MLDRLKPLQRIREIAGVGLPISLVILAIVSSLLTPALILVVGLVSVHLASGSLEGTSVELGSNLRLPVPPQIASVLPIGPLAWLVLLGLLIALALALTLWLHRRAADQAAAAINASLHRRLMEQSLRRAESEGATMQRVLSKDLIDHQLPHLRRLFNLWYRAIPRSLLTLVGCLVVALLVSPWLAACAVVEGLWIGWLFRRIWTNQRDRDRWEIDNHRGRMSALIGRAPLLSRSQSRDGVSAAFESELKTLERLLDQRESKAARTWPTLFAAVTGGIAILLLGLGVNVGGGSSLPAAVLLTLCMIGVIISFAKLWQLWRALSSGQRAAQRVEQYFRVSPDVSPSEQRVGFTGLREAVRLDNVTLKQTDSKASLSHVHLALEPGQLVSILGTDDVTPNSLAELLMGFGLPAGGTVRFDDVLVRDIHPRALAKHVMWIDPTGPLYDGTIEENLRGDEEGINTGDMVKALESVQIYERLFRLPEGLNTVIQAHESILDREASYAVGVARAILHRPSVVIALEPPSGDQHDVDDPCLEALRGLAEQGSVVVMLPQRLQTLRVSDRVILFQDATMIGEGKHAKLLADSDLYRHLNYQLFNPYRVR